MLASLAESALVVVDVQPTFLNPIFEAERVLSRCEFLVRCAKVLGVPVFATEQVPDRMGGTHERLRALLGDSITEPKMQFSCLGCESLLGWLKESGRTQVALVGIETHICVSQTAHQLLDQDFWVFLAEDGISARSAEMHRIGVERMRDYGATVAHSESLVYEWMGSAEHPAFREILKIVKDS